MKLKKIFIVGVVVLLVVALAGCQISQDVPSKENDMVKEEKIKFERVKYEDLNSEIQTNIDAKKKKNGHMLIKDKLSDYYYLVVFAGERRTGGYTVEITEVINNKDTTDVIVKETVPGKDSVVTCALTYPIDIIKLKGITDDINVIQHK